ncbi:MAG TPA: protein translocase subunit SecD [Gemmatimonadaceae bacterium]|nr:protein translocase subunit SecD [Gemmatimonadaceae bacterium]
MSNLKWRLIGIAALTALAAFFLFPRNKTVKTRGSDGVLRETVQRHVPLRYGLDLQGGMHIALEVDDSKQAVANKSEAIDRALKTVRNRIEGFGVSEPVVQKAGSDRIIVELPGIADQARALSIVESQAFLEFKITDKTQALERVLPRLDAIIKDKGLATAKTGGAAAATQPTSAQKGLQGLLTGTDTGKKADTSKKAAAAGTDSAAKDSLQLNAGGALSNLIQQGAMQGEYFVETSNVPTVERFFSDSSVKAALPPAREVLWGTDSTVMGGRTYKAFYVVDSRPIITGEYLTSAKPNTSPLEGTIVQFEMNNVGGRKFRNETGKHVGDYMAIVLDGRVMGRPPVIQSAIGTRGQITMGGKDLTAAQDLALVLQAGALPVPLRVAEIRTIGPSLGKDSIAAGLRAAAIAVALIVVIMIVYYRFSGMLAVGGLCLYVLYTLAALAGFDAVLTLPGLAGFVLSIGIAVDANVLIFERIREELDRGKTVRTAIDEGFRHAMPAIIDSNVSTILTAAVLYQWGTGPVRGFAVTLIAGVTASMVTCIGVVRTFYLLWLSRTRGTQTLSI